MKWFKLFLFAILPAIFLFVLIEGIAQLYWLKLENQALGSILANGEKVLRNDAINFLKQPDKFLGYRLRPNLPNWTNSKGFGQREEIEENRVPGSLRIVSVGESTTHGTNLNSNYPLFLSQILKRDSRGYDGNTEVLNAGVSGWVSDQWAIYSQRELKRYKPDIVIIYGGWNDFQYYSPFNGVPNVPFFKATYGTIPTAVGYLKSVTLGSAILKKISPVEAVASTKVFAEIDKEKSIYHFLFKNMTQTVKAFRANNPNVRIVISTLVSRWPLDTKDQFKSKTGHVHWMQGNGVGRLEAAELIKNLNEEIDKFAKTNDLILVDMAKVFSTLDRQKLMHDFCHMTTDGYKIMAGTFYEELRKRNIISGMENQKHKKLVRKYTFKTSQMVPPKNIVLNLK